MNVLNFETPIAVEMTVTKIDVINTIIGHSIYIEGTLLESNLKDKQICFYCPEPLHHLFSEMNLTLKDNISLKYLGKIRRKGTQIRDFFVERKGN